MRATAAKRIRTASESNLRAPTNPIRKPGHRSHSGSRTKRRELGRTRPLVRQSPRRGRAGRSAIPHPESLQGVSRSGGRPSPSSRYRVSEATMILANSSVPARSASPSWPAVPTCAELTRPCAKQIVGPTEIAREVRLDRSTRPRPLAQNSSPHEDHHNPRAAARPSPHQRKIDPRNRDGSGDSSVVAEGSTGAWYRSDSRVECRHIDDPDRHWRCDLGHVASEFRIEVRDPDRGQNRVARDHRAHPKDKGVRRRFLHFSVRHRLDLEVERKALEAVERGTAVGSPGGRTFNRQAILKILADPHRRGLDINLERHRAQTTQKRRRPPSHR